MKVLTKLLLIHWHYYGHEIIEFDKLNFLTGATGAGKSTIIDALQLILLGGTGANFFNKAANLQGERTLIGYLLGELGDDDDSGSRSLRSGGFTSYVALEFFDEAKQEYFSAGCCFDVHSASEYAKLFFRYNGAFHPQGFLENNVPLNISALRNYIKQHQGHSTTTGRDFLDDLYGKLGGLPTRFSELLKKAVSFNPNIKIHEFISAFVCNDQDEVDISHMQENIRSYKNLEHEAVSLQKRIASLEQIANTFKDFTAAKSREVLYSFLIDRARADIKRDELHKAEHNAKDFIKQSEELTAEISDLKAKESEQKAERDALNLEYKSNGEIKAKDEYDKQIAEKTQQLERLQIEGQQSEALLLRCTSQWRRQVNLLLQKAATSDIRPLGQQLLERIEIFEEVTPELIVEISTEGLTEIAECVSNLKIRAIELNQTLGDEQKKLSVQYSGILSDIETLESGIYPFPRDSQYMKNALKSHLSSIAGEDVNVRIVAEVSEIKNERWRNVIEGYLHSQKFYILVPQRYYTEAVVHFDAIKHKESIYGTGIVDTEKLMEHNPSAEQNSLAEEIETSDDEAQAFLNSVLGKVQKCDTLDELRNHRIGITDTGTLYQSFVTRAINKSRWKKPAIGQAAKHKRLDALRTEAVQLSEQVNECARVMEGLKAVRELPQISESEIMRIVECAKRMSEIPSLKSSLEALIKDRNEIDMTHAGVLLKRMEELSTSLSEKGRLLDQKYELSGGLREKIRALQDDTIPQLSDALQTMEAEITGNYNDEQFLESAALRYTKELNSRGTAAEIERTFPRKKREAENKKNSLIDSLAGLRHEYNHEYKMGYDVKSSTNEIYDKALADFTENELPKYHGMIEEAKQKAYEQFREDFISRLQNNITSAQAQINGLNDAIKGTPFGEETYRFKISPKPDHRHFYDMIMDDLTTHGGYNLYSQQFYEKYKEEIAELFAIITNDKNMDGEDEKRIREFTDYRTYLTFDIEVIGHDKKSQRLSKTMGKKSGGETQTPFYIAVLASFAQLYRTGRVKTHDTARLIIFDEAFSKMDSERIIRSIELLRKFNFQAILSAPPDKTEIIPHVDRTLCVLREGTNVRVAKFGKEIIECSADPLTGA